MAFTNYKQSKRHVLEKSYFAKFQIAKNNNNKRFPKTETLLDLSRNLFQTFLRTCSAEYMSNSVSDISMKKNFPFDTTPTYLTKIKTSHFYPK